MNDTTPTPREKPNMEPFCYYPRSIEDFPHTRTLNTIKSLAEGVSTLLKIIEADDLNDHDADTHRVMDASQVANLMRLAIAVTEVIGKEVDDAFEWSEKHGLRGWIYVPYVDRVGTP